MKWLNDPKNNEPSVSLTLVMVSFIVYLGVATAEAFGYVKSSEALQMLFMTSATLYFGRRVKRLIEHPKKNKRSKVPKITWEPKNETK